MKKIKVFASFLGLSSAKKEAKKQMKLLSNDSLSYPGAKVEIINALKLWKTNNWSQKNPYNLPYPTENDHLVCITYVEAQAIELEAAPQKTIVNHKTKKQNTIQNLMQLTPIKKQQTQKVIELVLPDQFTLLRLHRKLRLAS